MNKFESIIITNQENVQLRSTYSTAPFNVLGGALFQSEVVFMNKDVLPTISSDGSLYFSNGNFWGFCGIIRGWVSLTQEYQKWDEKWAKLEEDLVFLNPWKPFYGLDNKQVEGWSLTSNQNLAIGKEFTQPGITLEVSGTALFDDVQIQGLLRCDHGIRVGSHSKTIQGMIRYQGGQFQGYNGEKWINFCGNNWLRWVKPIDWMFYIQDASFTLIYDKWCSRFTEGDRIWVVNDKKKLEHFGWFVVGESGKLETIEENGDFLGVAVRNCVKKTNSTADGLLLNAVYFLQGTSVLPSLIQLEEKGANAAVSDINLQCSIVGADTHVDTGIDTEIKLPEPFRLLNASIDSEHLNNQILQSRHFNKNTISGTFISDNAIEPRHLVPGCFRADHIGESVIRAVHLARNIITSAHLSEGCLREYHLPADGFQASRLLAKNSIVGDMLPIGVITGDKISNGAIRKEHLPSKIIESIHLTQNVIQSNHVGDKIIQARHIERGILNSDFFRPESINGNIIQTGTGRPEWFRPGVLPGWVLKTGTVHGSIISEGTIDKKCILSCERGFHISWKTDGVLQGEDWVELGGKLEIRFNNNYITWDKIPSQDSNREWTFVRRAKEDLEIGDRTVFDRMQWSQFGYHEQWINPEARWSQIEIYGQVVSKGTWHHEGPWHQRGILDLNDATVNWDDYKQTKNQLNRVWIHGLYHACPKGVIVCWQDKEPPIGWKVLDIPGPNGMFWIQKTNVDVNVESSPVSE